MLGSIPEIIYVKTSLAQPNGEIYERVQLMIKDGRMWKFVESSLNQSAGWNVCFLQSNHNQEFHSILNGGLTANISGADLWNEAYSGTFEEITKEDAEAFYAQHGRFRYPAY